MPAIYLFSKRTLLGGDDLQVPALLTIMTRLVQGLILVAPQWYYLLQEASEQWKLLNPNSSSNSSSSHVSTTFHKLVDFIFLDPNQQNDCPASHYYPLLVTIELMGVGIWLIASIILEIRLFHWSCQGTPTLPDREPRIQKVQTLLHWKLLVLTPLWAMLAILHVTTFMFWRPFRDCRYSLYDDTTDNDDDNAVTMDIWLGSNTWWLANVLLGLSQTTEVVLAAAFVLRLWQVDRMRAVADHPHELTEALWEDRCNFMCRCLSMSTCFLLGGQELGGGSSAGGSGNVYQPLSQALADYLETRGTLDVVPTDLVTGLLVLQRVQRQRILQARVQVVRSSQSQLQLMQRGDESSSSNSTRGVQSSTATPRRVLEVESSAMNDGNGANIITPIVLSSSAATASVRGLKRRASSQTLAGPTAPTPSHTPPPSGNTSTILPETTRLVPTDVISPSTRPIYRRLEHPSISPLQPPSSPPTSAIYQSHSRVVLNPHNPTDCFRLEEGARMAKFSLSIYTWMLYVFVHPISGIPRLMCQSCRLCCPNCPPRRSRSRSTDETSSTSAGSQSSLLQEGRSSHYGETVGDNLCQWHKKSLLLVAGIPEADLVYAQFRNGLSLVPYCIMLDHQSQSLIVAVRGSLSLDDLVTDVNLDPEPVQGLAQEHGFDADDQQYCHAGIVACARNVYTDLQKHGLLEEVLREKHPDYHLRLVGHSLGAGVATLLGYMLKAQFPSLKVFNFSPPGCAMTWDLATQCEAWATTFVLDSDIVPRLSVMTLERLRDEVLDLLGRLKVPKHKVVQSFWTGQSNQACFWGGGTLVEGDLQELNRLIGDWLFEEESGSYMEPEQPPAFQQTPYFQQLQEFWRIQEERKQTRGAARSLLLYPPGRMIHLIKTGEEGGCGHLPKKIVTCCTTNSGFQYTPVYIANDDLDEIVVGPTMATDHFIDRMADQLSQLASDYTATNNLASDG